MHALIGGDLQGGSATSNAVINAVFNGASIVGVAATAENQKDLAYKVLGKYLGGDGARKVSNGVARSDLGFSVAVFRCQ